MNEPKPENLSATDFFKYDIRVGTVLLVEAVPKSKKLLKLEVSFGPGVVRTILAGIAQAHMYGKVEDGVWKDSCLVGGRVVAVLNLAPRVMAGITSHGMLLATHCDLYGVDTIYLLSGGPASDGSEVG